MNARDGMARLYAERKAMGLCRNCGRKLPQGFRFRACDECRAQERIRHRKLRQKRRDAHID